MRTFRQYRKGRTPAEKDGADGRLLSDPAVARPLPSLVFLSPLLVFYTIGVIWVRPDLAARADLLVREFIRPLGITGVLAPTYLVVAVLVASHIVRGDPARFPARVLMHMAVETAILAVPMLAIHAVFRVLPQALLAMGAAGAGPDWLDAAMTSIGAGIYEELLFRLLMVGGTLWLLRRLFNRQGEGLRLAVVLIAAGVFAGAHTLDNPQAFAWDSFLFRTAAGTYLGYVFAWRGFGIAVGVHMVFNLLLKLADVARM